VLRLLEQPGWKPLDQFVMASRVRVASELVLTECRRAILRAGGSADLLAFATTVLERIDLIPISTTVLRRAADLQPASLRTLDAIHLATALEIGPIDGFVTYDRRLTDAARQQGLPLVVPRGP
jgi:uncharacterized protein